MLSQRVKQILVLNSKFGSLLKFYPFDVTIESTNLKILVKSKRQQRLTKIIGIILCIPAITITLSFGSIPYVVNPNLSTLTEKIFAFVFTACGMSILGQSFFSLTSIESMTYIEQLFFNADPEYGKRLSNFIQTPNY